MFSLAFRQFSPRSAARVRSLLLALVLATLSRAVAAAQADPAAYDHEIAEAMAAHQTQRWSDAMAHFERAHALKPNARTLRGMGASAFEAGLFAQAVRDLEASLVHPERPLSAELQKAVEALLLEARPQVGIYVLRVQPAQAELKVDDKAPLTGPRGEVLLDRGVHRVVVSSAGYMPQELELDVHGGEREEVRLVLAAAPTEPAPEPQVLASSLPPVAVAVPAQLAPGPRRDLVREPVRRPLVRPFALATSALAVASVGVAGGLYALARSRIDDIASECRETLAGACTTEQALVQKDAENVDRLERAITATVVVALASAVTATVLWVVDARAHKRGKARSFAPQVVRF